MRSVGCVSRLTVALAVLASCGDPGDREPVLDVAATSPGGGGSGPIGLLPTDAGADVASPPIGTDASVALPPPEPPPLDDERAVHLVVERDGALWVARVVPAGAYVGPVGEALPVAPADLESGEPPPPLWARDEGPRVVVDFGDAGVYAGEGGAWKKLGDAPTGDVRARPLAISDGVDRVLLGYWVIDTMTYQYTLSGALWSTAGEALYTAVPLTHWQGGGFGVFASDGATVAVREAAGFSVRQALDGSQTALVPITYVDPFALFATSLVVGQNSYPFWVGFDGMPITQPPELSGKSWRAFDLAGVPHADVDGIFYRLEDRAVVEAWPLAPGMAPAAVLGYADGSRLLGLISASTSDAGTTTRQYVVLAPDGTVTDSFEPEASVVEEEGGLTGVEWERRPTAAASHVDAERVAVVLEVRHTYFRGAYGVSAALSEEVWIVDADGARTHRIAQHPPVEETGALPELDRQWRFTGDGEHLVWNDGAVVRALALDTLEAVALREAF